MSLLLIPSFLPLSPALTLSCTTTHALFQGSYCSSDMNCIQSLYCRQKSCTAYLSLVTPSLPFGMSPLPHSLSVSHSLCLSILSCHFLCVSQGDSCDLTLTNNSCPLGTACQPLDATRQAGQCKTIFSGTVGTSCISLNDCEGGLYVCFTHATTNRRREGSQHTKHLIRYNNLIFFSAIKHAQNLPLQVQTHLVTAALRAESTRYL